MASRPIDPSSRHVGRIVDPMVREDGEQEPELSLESKQPLVTTGDSESTRRASDSAGAEPAAAPGTEQPALRGQSVRERLLEKANHARRTPVESSAEAPRGDDLDEIGRRVARTTQSAETNPRAPGSPVPSTRSALPPTVLALFGTLMGMAVIASVTAVAMHIAPHRENAVEAPTLSASAAPAPLPKAAAEREKPQKRKRQRLPGPYRISEAAGDASLRIVEGKVGTEPFLKAVQGAGVPSRESYRVITAFQGVRNFDRCNKSDRFVALLDRQSQRLKAFEFIVSEEEVYQAREGQNGLLEAAKLDLKVERTPVAGALVYDGKSFDDSAEQAGFERGLGRVVAKALDGHSALDELERGDVIRLIAQEVTVLGEFARYAGVEALELKRAKGDALRVYYFDASGERGYYDAKGRSPHNGGWRKPIPGAPITSRFNLKRLHPILKKIVPHLGTDIGAPTGTPVGASAPGTVTYIGYAGPAGNLVKVAHAGDIETGYAHLSRFAEGLKVGAKVRRLELVGYVGSTGRSTGPHLHFSATKKGDYFDPEKLDLDGMRTLGGGARTAFESVMQKYDPLLDAIVLPDPLPAEEPAVERAPAAASASAPGFVHSPDAELEDEEADAPPPPLPAAPPASAPRRAGSSIYLTDKELLELQGATDDGEVSQ